MRSATLHGAGDIGVREEQGELVPSDAADQIEGSPTVPQYSSDAGQHMVADDVPVGVVDGLELIDIDHQEAEGAPTADRSGDLLLHPLTQHPADGTTCQFVDGRHVGQRSLKLGPVLFDPRPVDGGGNGEHRGTGERGKEEECPARRAGDVTIDQGHQGQRRQGGDATDPRGSGSEHQCSVNQGEQEQDEDRAVHAAVQDGDDADSECRQCRPGHRVGDTPRLGGHRRGQGHAHQSQQEPEGGHRPQDRAMWSFGREDEVADDHERLGQEDAKSDTDVGEPEGSPRSPFRVRSQVRWPADPACSSSCATLPFTSLSWSHRRTRAAA